MLNLARMTQSMSSSAVTGSSSGVMLLTVTKLGDKYYKIVLDHSYANYTNIGYIMFSAQGTGDGVVVTKNEEIL